MRLRRRRGEWLPWYRDRSYSGPFTEAEKRQLDSFRTLPKHPAADVDDPPQEVREYISLLEMQLYDEKQGGAAGRAIFISAIGIASLVLIYVGCLGSPSVWSYGGAALLSILPWVNYRLEWDKNAEEFLPSGNPYNPTTEGIRSFWESNYVIQLRNAKQEGQKRE